MDQFLTSSENLLEDDEASVSGVGLKFLSLSLFRREFFLDWKQGVSPANIRKISVPWEFMISFCHGPNI